MSSRHPNLGTLERFAAVDLAIGAMLETGRHVVTCTSCRTRLREEIAGGREMLERLSDWLPGPADDDYDQVFARIETAAPAHLLRVHEERRRAHELLTELERVPIERRLALACSAPRFQNAALATLLLDSCREVSNEDAEAGEAIASLGLAIADRLDPAVHGRGLQNDLRARSWALIGNARRIRYDLEGAATAFEHAESFLEEGSMDPLERAQVLDLKTALLGAQRRLAEAFEALQEVVRIYRQAGPRRPPPRGWSTLASSWRNGKRQP